jgi:mono/diheme cytochrome c family protein
MEGRDMPKISIVLQVSLLACLVAVSLFASRPTPVTAQEGGAVSGQSASRPLPLQHPSGTKLTEQQVRGAGVFIQRCALCHLAKTFGAAGSKFCCVASLGPNLAGLFKNLTPDQEKAFRDIILNGGPTYMPPWKYGLTAEEIDDIVAYLKTLS